ncbi:MAG: hypothetical protein M8467_11785 [Anaerolineae bacterium]|nr:hypothetical protein [Anaerolineae bacterium]
MDPTKAVTIVILGVAWLSLLFATFRPPDSPKISRLLLFQLLLLVSLALGYMFLIYVLRYNPNPARVSIARFMSKDRMIYLGDLVPGVYDLDYLSRVDTDYEPEDIPEEWLAFYQYDVSTPPEGSPQGPFGAAIYDYDLCRPPAILSFELAPVNYDYLGQNWAGAGVANIIPYNDPVSAYEDRPEVIINGYTLGAVTDLNIFRKTGVPLGCLQRQEWQRVHPGEAFPNPIRYENIGSFRGNYRIRRGGATVTVVDRSPFERSQITIERQYRPLDGSYFQAGTDRLLDPVEFTLAFGPGEPDQVPGVYYPEKTVLAFYKNLGKDRASLEKASSWLSEDAQALYDIERDPFGLSTAEDSVARARSKLARVLVWEIRYVPNTDAERLHETREVTVQVVGVNADGEIDYAHPCQVTWSVVGVPNARALPYGCEWRLETYWTTCVGGK